VFGSMVHLLAAHPSADALSEFIYARLEHISYTRREHNVSSWCDNI
jgi:hypothetical protein